MTFSPTHYKHRRPSSPHTVNICNLPLQESFNFSRSATLSPLPKIFFDLVELFELSDDDVDGRTMISHIDEHDQQ
ncbi:hypothetical protein QN277_011968 [Acacia crassicarpa]|uniref:Uncharacterized protein n=1 Tax=Acacia crassicarpa TaxID=499986 RepID=A0AAE1MZX2_9FABA|nr:hypothetical protein QN277_011968 [Acacia crassicarpa]